MTPQATSPTGSPEDPRITRAREILAQSRNDPPDEPDRAARWWGRLEAQLEILLGAIDEGAAR